MKPRAGVRVRAFSIEPIAVEGAGHDVLNNGGEVALLLRAKRKGASSFPFNHHFNLTAVRGPDAEPDPFAFRKEFRTEP